jgi:predicted MPP superfamily phosphohydrolase
MRSLLLAAAIAFLLASYGGLHFYAYRKLRSLFPAYRRAIIAALVLLWGSLFVSEFATHGNSTPTLAVPLAWGAFTWMGLVFLFFMLSAPIDLLAMLARMAGFDATRAHLASPRRTVIVGAITVAIAAYGLAAAHRYNIERVTLASPRLATALRIVQISDLHLGLLSDEDYLQRMVDDINALQPDLIVATGDLVDMQSDHLDGFSTRLARLSARLGKYAVYGNHEAFAGIDASRAFIERAGFTLLSNSGVTLANSINLLGVDDPGIESRITTSSVNEAALLARFRNGLFTVLLKHQPVVAKESRGLFDLQLSGHTHGGQIFPFRFLTRLVYHAPFGLSEVVPDNWLYVSRGAGTWGPPMRVLAAPEITLIELRPAPPQSVSPSNLDALPK